jgi:hypothetical protein
MKVSAVFGLIYMITVLIGGLIYYASALIPQLKNMYPRFNSEVSATSRNVVWALFQASAFVTYRVIFIMILLINFGSTAAQAILAFVVSIVFLLFYCNCLMYSNVLDGGINFFLFQAIVFCTFQLVVC